VISRINRQNGFTLLEIMIVFAVIAILTAVAIPQFASYKQKGYDSAAESDLRNAKIVIESFFAENHFYP